MRQMVAAGVLILLGMPTVGGQGPDASRAVYVTALDREGKPVQGLTEADLSVKEDGRSRDVLSVAPATTRLSVVLLVDDGGLGLNDIRTALAGFMGRLLERAEFSIVGIAEQNRTLVPLTSERGDLSRAISGLRSVNVSGGGHLLEAVGDAITQSERKEVVRPVIVIVTNQMHEYGDPDAAPILQRLSRSGTSLYVVETLRRYVQTRQPRGAYDAIAQASQDNEAAEADQARQRVLGDGPRQTGGRRLEVDNTADLPAALETLAAELAGQYLLVFASDARSDASPRLTLTTTRRGVTLRAPMRSSGTAPPRP